jgi:hypothetical protein
MNILMIIAAVASLALLIMSSIIRGSAAKLDESTETKNIKNTSNILLVISLVLLGVTGFNVYQDFAAQKAASTAFAYYF